MKNDTPSMETPEVMGTSYDNNLIPDFFIAIPALLQPLYQAYQQRLEANSELQQALAYFVPLEATTTRISEARQPLIEEIHTFMLTKKRPLLLLQGDSGSGKSVFMNVFEKQCWEEFLNKKSELVPLFIDLKSLASMPSQQNFVDFRLQECEYTLAQIAQLRTDYSWVILLDGYDEMVGLLKDTNLYRVGHLQEWSAKIIITCRSEYLKGDYSDYFTILDPSNNNTSSTQGYQECFIAPFSESQIDIYLQQYSQTLQQAGATMSPKAYLARFKELPNLKSLVSSPLLLRMVAEIIPELAQRETFTLARIYQQFTDRWFERERQRLQFTQQVDLPKGAFNVFCQGLAFAMFMQGVAEVDYVPPLPDETAVNQDENNNNVAPFNDTAEAYQAEEEWELFFSDQYSPIKQLRQGAPLRRLNDTRYSFFHKSFMEYFTARFVLEELLQADHPGADTTHRLVQSIAISPLNARLLMSQPAVLVFLGDMISDHNDRNALRDRLIQFVQASQSQPTISVAAANSISLLAAARISLTGIDFAGVHIAYANLEGAFLDGANLQGADLRGVNLTKVSLQQANLAGANLIGAQWGERPIVKYEGDIHSIAYSPDRRYRAVAVSKEIHITNLSTGQQQTFIGHTGRVLSVAWSAVGELASGSDDKTVIVWDMARREVRQRLQGHTDSVTSVSWSVVGELASGSDDKTVIVWDMARGEVRQRLQGHMLLVTSVAWSVAGELASGSWDHTVIVWDTARGEVRQRLQGHTHSVTSVSWSVTGELASGSRDHTIIVWDMARGEIRQRLQGHTNEVKSVAWSAAGELASGSHDKIAIIWDAAHGRVRQQLQGHTGGVDSVAWNAGELTSGSRDHTVIVWDIECRQVRQRLQGHIGRVTSVAWSAAGELASGGWDNTVILWDVARGQVRQQLQGHKNYVTSVAWSAAGELASGSWDTTVIIWDVAPGQVQKQLQGHTGRVTSVAWSAAGELASGSWDNTVIVWDVAHGQVRQQLEGHLSLVTSVAWSAAGGLASGSYDNTVIVWSTARRQIQQRLGHKGLVTNVAWNAADELASGCGGDGTDPDDSSLLVWDTTREQVRQRLRGHKDLVTSVAWSSAGELASGSKDGIIIIWDLEQDRPQAILSGYLGPVTGLAWYTHQRQTYLATASGDHAVKVWQQVSEGAQPVRWHLYWSSHPRLLLEGCQIQGVQGLTSEQLALLQQKGAIDRSISETSKKEKKSRWPKLFLGATAKTPSALISNPSIGPSETSSATVEIEGAIPLKTRGTFAFIRKRLQKTLPAQVATQLPTVATPGADTLWHALQKAPLDSKHALTIITDYLQQGGDANVQELQTGRTFLGWAIQQNQLNVARMLLQVDANLNVPDADQCTPLHIATQQANSEAVQLLLKFQAKANMRDKFGKLPSEYCTPGVLKDTLQTAEAMADKQDLQQAKLIRPIRERLRALEKLPELAARQQALAALKAEVKTLAVSQDVQAQLLRQIVYTEQRWQRSSYLGTSSLSLKAVDQALGMQGLLKEMQLAPDPYLTLAIALRRLVQSKLNQLLPEQREALVKLLPLFNLQLQPVTLLVWPKKPKHYREHVLSAEKPLPLKPRDPLFMRLQARVALLEKTGEVLQKTPELFKGFCEQLQAVIQADKAYIDNFCQPSVEARKACLVRKMSLVLTDSAGYVSETVAQKLCGPRENSTGNHNVTSLKGLHFKPKPDQPGMQLLVSEFAQLLGLPVATNVELGQVYEQSETPSERGYRWPLLISKTIEGYHYGTGEGSLSYDPDFRKAYQAAAPASTLPIDFDAFVETGLAVMNILPYDGKGDNYMAPPHPASQAQGDKPVLRRIEGIDDDLAMLLGGSDIITQANGEHVSNVHYFGFLDQEKMNQALTTAQRQRCMAYGVEQLTLQLMQSGTNQVQECEHLSQAGVFNEQELQQLHLPPKCVPGGLIAFYDRFKRLQDLLNRPDKIVTLNDLLRELLPLTYAFYQGFCAWLPCARRTAHEPYSLLEGMNRFNRFRALIYHNGACDGNSPFTLEAIVRDLDLLAQGTLQDPQQSLETLHSLQQSTDPDDQEEAKRYQAHMDMMQKRQQALLAQDLHGFIRQHLAKLSRTPVRLMDFITQRTQSFAEAKAEWLAHLDFRQLSVTAQQAVIKGLLLMTDLKTCTLKYCPLTDTDLYLCVQQNRSLTMLTLIGCEGVTLNGLKQVLSLRPRLHLVLGSSTQLKVKDWLELQDKAEHFSLLTPSGEVLCFKERGQEKQQEDLPPLLLNKAVKKDPAIQEFCLAQGFEISISAVTSSSNNNNEVTSGSSGKEEAAETVPRMWFG